MLRARRREASRRRRLLRVDVGLGVLAALVLLLATPGLAIAAICAGLLLAACGISLALQRRRARRQIAASASRRGGAGEGRPSG